jgi:Tfp pilus assembly protein PilO
MSARAQLIVASIVAAIVCIAFFFLFVKPRQSELAEVNEQIETANAETVRLQADLDRLRALQENAPLLEARLNEIRELIPQDDQVANFIFLVQDAATRSGVDFVQITPELPDVPPEGAQVAEVRASIAAEGGYFSIQDFVRRLYLLDRAVRLDSLGMTQAEDVEIENVQIRMDSVARIFFELPASGATPGGATTAPAPAPSPSPTPTPAG